MLQADGITYEIETQDGPLKLLDNVSFNVPKGHFMAVVGPSGCGKTTLLKAIAGMIAETDGRFFWNGHDLAEEDFEPTEIGFVPQFSIAYDQLSVDENVESAAKLRCKFESLDDLDDSIDNALEVTGMEGIADRDVKILSGGQKRRLALAMELVSNPRLLICDEVTSGLDPRSEHDIVNLLHEVSRSDGRIVISVTHSLAHLDRYDSILVMHQGCVAYHGSPKTILHYFGVSALEEIYPKLQDRNGVSWCRSWAKHRESYYARLEKEREQKMLSGELPDPNAGPTDEQK
ncbi:MAG: ABC transporter ATP-binding protein, partial [Akkermansia sp.]